MHSSFSLDSDTPAEEMILSAISKGLKGICLTEHHDPDYPDIPEKADWGLDIQNYHSSLLQLKEQYKDQLEIRFGIELGLQPHLANGFSSLLKEYPFDFVIGSSHVLHGEDPYYPRFFAGRDEAECYTEYFESILENLNAFSDFDVYGHIDYIVRYGPNKNQNYSYSRYREILDAILKSIIGKNVGLEINTGGFHYGLGQPNPCSEVIRRYRELGGEIVTIGADAHTPDTIARDFQKAAEILHTCGFRYYTVFRNRKPEFISL